MVFNGTENSKFSHNHNSVNFFHLPSGRPLKCIPIAHQNFQAPRASGRLLNAHPVFGHIDCSFLHIQTHQCLGSTHIIYTMLYQCLLDSEVGIVHSYYDNKYFT